MSSSTARRVAVLSARHLRRFPAGAAAYECEELVCAWEGADLLAPELVSATPLVQRVAARLEKHTSVSVGMAPRLRKRALERPYDLLYVHCMALSDLAQLSAAAPDFRQRTRLAVCRIEELWADEVLENPRYYEEQARLLERFDLVLLGSKGSVAPLMEATGLSCIGYAPVGIDVPTFCPTPPMPSRCIDVLGLGRRSERTHQALLALARAGRIFYVFDTSNGASLIDPQQHRFQLASFIQRAKYFVVYQSRFDHTHPVGAEQEVGIRFFEGAAAGAVLIGDPPTGQEFARLFDWPDAIIRLPFGSTEVATLLEELERDPERMDTVRRANLLGCLRRHDWVYRWQEVLARLGLPPTQAMQQRKRELGWLAERIAEG